jgi:hypothetical protein
MKLRHSLEREGGSLAVPRKPQLLEVSGQGSSAEAAKMANPDFRVY